MRQSKNTSWRDSTKHPRDGHSVNDSIGLGYHIANEVNILSSTQHQVDDMRGDYSNANSIIKNLDHETAGGVNISHSNTPFSNKNNINFNSNLMAADASRNIFYSKLPEKSTLKRDEHGNFYQESPGKSRIFYVRVFDGNLC